MSTKYRYTDKSGVYFTTSTTVGWLDVFTREVYLEIILDSIRFCQRNQGLQLHAWVMMTSHLHMIYSCIGKEDLGMVLKNMKSFTAIQLIDRIINNPKESRHEYMLNLFESEGKKSSSNYKFKVWQHENHPILGPKNNFYGIENNLSKPRSHRFTSPICKNEAWHWGRASCAIQLIIQTI